MLNRTKGGTTSISRRALIPGVFLLSVALTAAIVLLLRGGGNQVTADTGIVPRAARLDRVDGQVNVGRVDDNQQTDWTPGTVNTPVTVGNRVYTQENSRASIALTGRNSISLNPQTSIDVLALDEHRTQLALKTGSAIFDVPNLNNEDFYEVGTPCGAVNFKEPGLYQIGMDGENAVVSVLSGLAQVMGLEGSGTVSKGQVVTLLAASASQAVSSTLSPQTAGGIVDDYYQYRYPRRYDGRYKSYETYLSDPFYFDSYRNSPSWTYVSSDLAGLYELDDYGDWQVVDDYGYCWAPRVSAGWAPFRFGRWDFYDVWGPSWISSEPWGWAPYHYGRWFFVRNRWFWVPGDLAIRRTYCPAPVAFIPLIETNQIAWVPLGPREVYVPRYYGANFEPRFLGSPRFIKVFNDQRTFVNVDTPNGVTVVPVRSLVRPIDPRIAVQADTNVIRRSRAAIDPFEAQAVRQVVQSEREARHRFAPTNAEEAVFNRKVITSQSPAALPDRLDTTRAFGVQSVPDNRRSSSLKFEQAPQVANTREPDRLPLAARRGESSDRQRAMNDLSARAAGGDRSARRELRRMMREQPEGTPPAAPNATPERRMQVPQVQPDSRAKEPRGQQQADQGRLHREIHRQLNQEHRPRAASAGQMEAARRAQTQQQSRHVQRQERRNQVPKQPSFQPRPQKPEVMMQRPNQAAPSRGKPPEVMMQRPNQATPTRVKPPAQGTPQEQPKPPAQKKPPEQGKN